MSDLRASIAAAHEAGLDRDAWLADLSDDLRAGRADGFFHGCWSAVHGGRTAFDAHFLDVLDTPGPPPVPWAENTADAQAETDLTAFEIRLQSLPRDVLLDWLFQNGVPGEWPDRVAFALDLGDDGAAAQTTTEIVRLHDAISGWFRGDGPDDFTAIQDALADDFVNIQPSGRTLSKAGLCAPIRAARGQNPAFDIRIEQPRLIAAWPDRILATYVEHQTGARNSAPDNRRRSLVLFARGPRLTWLYLKETGL